MAEEKKNESPEMSKAEKSAEETPDLLRRFFSWLEKTPIDEIIFLGALIIGVASKKGERIIRQMAGAGGVVMKRVGIFFQFVDPYIINFLRAWLRIVAVLFVVGILCLIFGGKILALVCFIAATVVLIIPLFILTPQRFEKGEGLISKITGSVVNTLREFLVSLNTVCFILLAIICLFFFVPAEFVSLMRKLGIVLTLIMLLPLSRILSLRWLTGLVMIWVAVVALQIGLISFPGTVSTMAAERRLAQESSLVKVGIDEDMTAYDIIGRKIDVVPKNTIMLAKLTVTSRDLNGRTTVLCYYKSDGPPYYMPLVPKINYHVIE